MTEKRFAEFSDPFSWDCRSLIPNRPPPSIELSDTYSGKQLSRLSTILYVLSFLVAALLIVILGVCCAILVLVDDNCGPGFGHFGCDARAEAESPTPLLLLPGG